MKIIRLANKFNNFIYYLFYFKSFKLAFLFSYYKLDLKYTKLISREGDFIIFKKNGNKISISQLSNFKFNIDYLFIILNADFSTVTFSNADYFLLNINSINFKVTSLSNLAVLYEIFVQNIYNVNLSTNNIIVVDIGMNIGAATLYFANQSFTEKVYGFEPFPETYMEASSNIQLNESVIDKVVLFNKGVSSVTEKRAIYQYESGLLSASTINLDENSGNKIGQKIVIDLISITDLLDIIKKNHPLNKIMLKIDCEGEEYSIFESLSTTAYLNDVSCIAVEWHELGPEKIKSVLNKFNFQYYEIKDSYFNAGIIYAFK
jgi:FkbM family methyltransferase